MTPHPAGVVLAFGTFDGFHPGHAYFLTRAASFGTRLVVGIARDAHVQTLKHKTPRFPEEERRRVVAAFPLVDEAQLSDETLGTYEILERVHPDVVVFGYDQHALEEDFRRHLAQTHKTVRIERIKHKEINVALALLEREDKILLIQRKDANPLWDKKWEFPGGKMNHGEDARSAVEREVLEETGLSVTEATFLGLHHYDWQLPDMTLTVHLHLFRCKAGEGDLCLEEDHAYQHLWTHPKETDALDLLEANAEILKKFYP